MINLSVRFRNKNFWLTLLPALALLVQAILALFGVSIDLGKTLDLSLDVVNTAFAVLAIVGVVNDPTTAGLADSRRALTYERPKED